jgi:phage-related protein
LKTEIVFYREGDGSVPILRWLEKLPLKARDKCLVRLVRLEQLGHELRRPEADCLRDGIYELRASYQGNHYRVLYFFSGQAFVVVSHGLVKLRVVPPREIEKALRRKRQFEADPETHTFKPES